MLGIGGGGGGGERGGGGGDDRGLGLVFESGIVSYDAWP